MHRGIFCIFLFFSTQALYAQKVKKVLLVIADGIPADVIERLKPPHLMAVAGQGFYTRAYVGGRKGTYSETPTISAPGYMDMLTGTWAYKHNVWDNDNQYPNRNYPTIFRAFKQSSPKGNIAIFSTWQDNRRVLIGEGLPETNRIQMDERFDGYEKDSLRFPHDTASWYLHQIDEEVVHQADSVIRQVAPDLSWIYLEYTDDVGHSKGTGAAFDSAIGLFDLQIEKIKAAIDFRESERNEEWLMLVTTDHGRDSITGSEHGDQSARERTTWIVSNRDERNDYARSNTPAIVDIFPTVSEFLRIGVLPEVKRELDGVPMFGQVSLWDPQISARDDKLTIRWKTSGPAVSVKMSISYTDLVRKGGKDKYFSLGEARSDQGEFSATAKNLHLKAFYKVILETPQNTAGTWLCSPDRHNRP